jgi:hypothetical protein
MRSRTPIAITGSAQIGTNCTSHRPEIELRCLARATLANQIDHSLRARTLAADRFDLGKRRRPATSALRSKCRMPSDCVRRRRLGCCGAAKPLLEYKASLKKYPNILPGGEGPSQPDPAPDTTPNTIPTPSG